MCDLISKPALNALSLGTSLRGSLPGRIPVGHANHGCLDFASGTTNETFTATNAVVISMGQPKITVDVNSQSSHILIKESFLREMGRPKFF